MPDTLKILSRLRRPRLLIQAARAGCEDYRRAPHLRRLLGTGRPANSGDVLVRLVELEDTLNHQRRSGDNAYCLITHVDVLIAMMCEARTARTAPSQV